MDSGYFETGNQVHSSMIIPGILQTAELKASLESKIAMLTEKIKELTSHPLEGMEFELIIFINSSLAELARQKNQCQVLTLFFLRDSRSVHT